MTFRSLQSFISGVAVGTAIFVVIHNIEIASLTEHVAALEKRDTVQLASVNTIDVPAGCVVTEMRGNALEDVVLISENGRLSWQSLAKLGLDPIPNVSRH